MCRLRVPGCVMLRMRVLHVAQWTCVSTSAVLVLWQVLFSLKADLSKNKIAATRARFSCCGCFAFTQNPHRRESGYVVATFVKWLFFVAPLHMCVRF